MVLNAQDLASVDCRPPRSSRMRRSRRSVRFAAGAFLLIAFSLPGCGRNPAAPQAPVALVYPVDASPAWSPDGHWVAFHRRQASPYGPPGLYIVNALGGPIRLLAPGDFFWPEFLSFSPDGRRIAFVVGLQLYIVDVATGSYWSPIATANGATDPDWSPDGRHIVYRRPFTFSLTPPDVDSGGIHVLDVVDGSDAILRPDSLSGNRVYFGKQPHWSGDGKQIAFLEGRPDGYALVLVGKQGSPRQVVAVSPPGDVFDDLLHFARPSAGVEGFAFWQLTGRGAGPYYVNNDGCCIRPFEERYSPHEAFSRDGNWIVETGLDPVDTAEVLFVRRFGDPIGASRRQLTHWRTHQQSAESESLHDVVAGMLKDPAGGREWNTLNGLVSYSRSFDMGTGCLSGLPLQHVASLSLSPWILRMQWNLGGRLASETSPQAPSFVRSSSSRRREAPCPKSGAFDMYQKATACGSYQLQRMILVR